MILDIYKDSLEYSAKDWKILILLGVISLFSFLLIPIFLSVGYNYKIIKTAVHGIINGRDPLPDFNDPANMLVDGIKVIVIQLVYFISFVVIFLIFTITGAQFEGMLSSTVLVLGWLITFILGIIAFLMLQMGVCHMAYNDGSFSKAFALKEIKEIIDEIGWFKCIVTYLGLIIITVVISVVVTALIFAIFTIFGVSVAMLGVNPAGIFILAILINAIASMFFIGPYLSIFNARSIGLLYTIR